MTVRDIYSKRLKRARGGVPDVYSYDKIPAALREQLIHLMLDVLGDPRAYPPADAQRRWKRLHDILAREYGVSTLTRNQVPFLGVQEFVRSADVGQILDVIEVLLDDADVLAIEEMNVRLREHAVGYSYENGQIIRVDSKMLHATAVKPALNLLSDQQYRGANEEFLKAHEHYRHGRHEEAMVDALKALESTLKIIFDKRGWGYRRQDAAKQLLDIAFTNGLVPTFVQSEFTALRSTLESGVPTVRNKQSGHGQGAQRRDVPRHLAEYALNLTASCILFLIESEQTLP